MTNARAAVSIHANATPCKNLTAKRGQKERNTMKARKVRAKSKAPNIITLFSEYFRRAPPAMSLENKADTPRMPTSTPISLMLDPKFAR